MLLSPLTLPEMAGGFSSLLGANPSATVKANTPRVTDEGFGQPIIRTPELMSTPGCCRCRCHRHRHRPSPSQCDDVSCSSCSSCSLVQRVLKSASGPEQDWAPPYTHFHFHFHFTNTSPTLELGKASIFPHLMKTKPIDRASLASLA